MHQIHFLVTAVNDVPIPKKKQQLYDVFQVPYWDGVSAIKPSITIKLDFRGPTVGDFVYHCHILDHEDAGMMAIIRVLPPAGHQADRVDAGAVKAAAARVTSR
jgi:FtsP/CotA-like multicopper oxidase with cupredoxin domain